MPERLIRRVLTHRLQRHALSTLVRTLSVVWASNPLIGIRCLLDSHALGRAILVVGRPAATAADAEKPEEARAGGEDPADPGGSENVATEGAMNAVGFENIVE